MIEEKYHDRSRVMRMRGNYVLLRADSLRLLMPQRELGSTEFREHLPTATEVPGVFTLIDARGSPSTVQALSEQLRPLERFPQDRVLLTRFAAAGSGCALAWNEVRVLIDTELEFHALPEIMQGEEGMIDAYVEIDHELAFCTTAQRLLTEVLANAN